MTGPPATVRAVIGLGSNLGDRRAHLRAAVAALSRLGEIDAVSPVYQTTPVGGPPQGPYLNAVVVLGIGLAPRDLLRECLAIERSRGRQRRERWGPRSLDLDLLLYGDEEIDEPGLRVPHPEMTRRRFVLEPLRDAWPDATLPDGTPLASFLPGVADQEVARTGALELQCRRDRVLVLLAVIAVALVAGVACRRLHRCST